MPSSSVSGFFSEVKNEKARAQVQLCSRDLDIIELQKRPESAEIIAGIAGTRMGWKETLRSERHWIFDVPTGGKSLREVEEFCVHPNTIKTLKVGECVSVKKYPRSTAAKISVRAPKMERK